MQVTEAPTPPRHRMRALRARLRAAGLRPVQIWVPDIRAPRLVNEAGRQSRLASRHAGEKETLTFIGQAADTGEPA